MTKSKNDSPKIPRSVAVIALALLIIVVGVVYLMRRGPDEKTALEGTRTSTNPEEIDMSALHIEKIEYPLPLVPIIDGVVEHPAETVSVEPTEGHYQFNMDVIFPIRNDVAYKIIIEAYGGEKLFGVYVPQQYLDAGTVPLNLDGKIFNSGKFRIEVNEETADSVEVAIAEAFFEVHE